MTLWGFDALLSLIVLYFFFVGLADGSVSSFNMGLWLLILAIVGAVMLGSPLVEIKQLSFIGQNNPRHFCDSGSVVRAFFVDRSIQQRALELRKTIRSLFLTFQATCLDGMTSFYLFCIVL